MPAWRLTTLTAALGFTATVLVAALPSLRFAYRSPPLHVSLETAEAVIGLVSAYLVFGRFSISGQLRDLALLCALFISAFANLFFSALPRAASGAPVPVFSTWAPVASRLLAAAVFTLCAFTGDRRLRNTTEGTARRAGALALLAASAILLLIGATVALLGDRLPRGTEPALSLEASALPRLVGHPAVLAVQLLGMLLWTLASVGFTRRASTRGDELFKWLGAGAALAAIARLNYFLFPSLYSNWVYTGDFLRLGFFLMLLVGSAREIATYWRRLTEAAVFEERRRLARELHDGLAQEFAFIRNRARNEPGPGEAPLLEEIAASAERGLDESRTAILALTRPLDEPMNVVLTRSALDVAKRLGVRLDIDLSSDVEVSPEVCESLTRIIGEAVTNAARHGRAREVSVRLWYGDGLHLTIADDGAGFDTVSVEKRGTGFGLISMRERAESRGGRLSVSSLPGSGTRIHVTLP